MKKVTAVLLVYAIIVVASCVFWIWYGLSKSQPTTGANTGNVQVTADAEKTRQGEEKLRAKTTELTGGVTDSRADDIVKSNDH